VTGTGPSRVLVVDDHALFRDGLVALIGRWPDFDVVGTAADGEEAVRLASEVRPDLILMDVRMPGMGGVKATEVIRRSDDRVRVVMLTMSNLGEDMFQALRNGAHGYMSKDEPADRLHDHLRAVLHGETVLSSPLAAKVLAEFAQPAGARRSPPGNGEVTLTRREQEVLRLVVEGLSNEEIAGQLHFSEATVKKHLGQIMAKLHLRNRVQVAVYGVRKGLVD
jgi:DNA-binding NarL/FixJ family response regulator